MEDIISIKISDKPVKSIKDLEGEGWKDTLGHFAHIKVYEKDGKKLLYDPTKQVIEHIYSINRQ